MFDNLKVIVGIKKGYGKQVSKTNNPALMKGRKKGKREKENSNILLDILTIILEKELKYHSETIDNLHLVQARNRQTKMGKAKKKKKKMIDRKPITELLLWDLMG